MTETDPNLAPLDTANRETDALGGAARKRTQPSVRSDVIGITTTDVVMQIPVTLKVVAGTVTIPVAELARMERGSLVPLDRRVGQKLDIVANGRVIARGEIVVLEGQSQRLGVSIDEVVGKAVGRS